jgi:glucokinase
LLNLYRFITEVEGTAADPGVVRALAAGEDAGEVIGTAGVQGRCPVCRDVVDWFLGLYGAQAANLAVTVMALGGVYVGGGIILKMLGRLEESGFLEAFFAKGRYRSMMQEMPVTVILNPRVSLIGAREAARELLA